MKLFLKFFFPFRGDFIQGKKENQMKRECLHTPNQLQTSSTGSLRMIQISNTV